MAFEYVPVDSQLRLRVTPSSEPGRLQYSARLFRGRENVETHWTPAFVNDGPVCFTLTTPNAYYVLEVTASMIGDGSIPISVHCEALDPAGQPLGVENRSMTASAAGPVTCRFNANTDE